MADSEPRVDAQQHERSPESDAPDDHASEAIDEFMAAEGGTDDIQPGDASGADAAKRTDADARLAELETQLDAALRTAALYKNDVHARQRDLEESRRYGQTELFRGLLEVIDNLQRAVAAAGRQDPDNPLVSGVRMVEEQLTGLLGKHGCQEISAEGVPFDPNVHEALNQMPSDQPAGHVAQVVQVGYKLHERVLRPSQVIVSTGPVEEA